MRIVTVQRTNSHLRRSARRAFGSMLVPMINVGVVRVRVGQRLVHMRVAVRLLAVPLRVLRVSMVQIVGVWMLVLGVAVPVRMLVVHGEMQADARAHQQSGQQQRQRERHA